MYTTYSTLANYNHTARQHNTDTNKSHRRLVHLYYDKHYLVIPFKQSSAANISGIHLMMVISINTLSSGETNLIVVINGFYPTISRSIIYGAEHGMAQYLWSNSGL